MKCLIVNLDHRKDRYQMILNHINEQADFYPIERFPAINGYSLVPTRQMEQLFNPNDYNYRRGIIGCALSHLTIWSEFVTDQPVFVLEDDSALVENCKEKIEYCLSQLKHTNWDILFLGYSSKNPITVAQSIPEIKLEKWNAQQTLQHSFGGTFGYIIHPSAISKLLSFIQSYGMTNAIDTMMIRASDHLDTYYCLHPLVYSYDHIISNNPLTVQFQNTIADTDIQHNYLSMKRSLTQRLNDELAHYSKLNTPVIIVYDTIEDNSKLKDHVVFCYDTQCKHPPMQHNITYAIEHVRIHIPFSLIQKNPELANVGLIYNGKWSTKPMLSNI